MGPFRCLGETCAEMPSQIDACCAGSLAMLKDSNDHAHLHWRVEVKAGSERY